MVILERFEVRIERASLLTYDGLCVGLTIITERSRIGLNNHVKPCAYFNKKSTRNLQTAQIEKVSTKLILECKGINVQYHRVM